MKTIFILLLFCTVLKAQNTLTLRIKDAESGEAINKAEVSVQSFKKTLYSDAEGRLVVDSIPDGEITFVFNSIGYESMRMNFKFPLTSKSQEQEILMEPLHAETEEIVITSTRLSRDISDIPTRIETISKEEIDEKINMEPANVVMLLNESTGISTQQTSATSGSSNIKIQGLDGRYTQVLKDGFPLYSGFSEGLSIMQIRPLDLKQVEIIKGPSSTLFGGGAIAGVINFVSIEPEQKNLLSGLVNFESYGGLDLGMFFAGKKGTTGLTALAAFTYKHLYDVDNDDFTEIPRIKSFTLSPKLFLYSGKNTTISTGVTAVYEDRTGGDVTLIKNSADSIHRYFERNLSGRYNLTFQLEKNLKNDERFTLKSSAGLFSRKIEFSDYSFKGNQYNTYSELSYLHNPRNHHLVAGLNFISENFREEKILDPVLRDYDYYTAGFFVQDTWDISGFFALETGLRYDYQDKYGSFLLPRATLFFKPYEDLTSRITGGLGYEIPNVFNEESESIDLKDLLPLSDELKAETSVGASLDLNYKTVLFGELSFSVNQMFFYTRIRSPLMLDIVPSTSSLFYYNSKGYIDSRGFETNLRLSYEPFKLFAGYTFTDAGFTENGSRMSLPLTPKHNLGIVLIYERHGNLRIGLESYYTGGQFLSDNTQKPSYWVMGIMAQKNMGNIILFLNLENFTDTRQSRYGPVVYSSHSNPQFQEIWTHTEGFYVNGGVKINLSGFRLNL